MAVAGLFAIPELVKGLFNRTKTASVVKSELLEGAKEFWRNPLARITRWVYWCIYRITTWTRRCYGRLDGIWKCSCPNPKERFGNGNIKGVIGSEGAQIMHKRQQV